LNAIVGISPNLTKKKFGDSKLPENMLDYTEISGPGGKFPTSGGDVFLHIKSNRLDFIFCYLKNL